MYLHSIYCSYVHDYKLRTATFQAFSIYFSDSELLDGFLLTMIQSCCIGKLQSKSILKM